MSPPKPTHPLAHLPDPPQNYIPCAPTKDWPSTMDEEQHSSQGNKWWWLVYLGPMQGAYATRATAVANVPSASKIENAIEYFDTLTDLNSRWKSCFHWHGHCPVHFACASVCHHPKPTPAVRTNKQAAASARNSVCAAQHTATRVPNDSAGSISSIPHAQHIAPSTPHDSASSISRIPRAGPAARLSGGRGQGGGVSGGSSQTSEFVCTCPSTTATATSLFCEARGTLLPSRQSSRPSPPSSSPPAYFPPSWSLPSGHNSTKPCLDLAPSWDFSMSTGGKSQYNKPHLFACDNPPTPPQAHSLEPDRHVKTEPKPCAKTEPEPRVKLKSSIKPEVKLKPNLQHDVERSHAPVPLYDPDSESDDSMGVDARDNFEDEEGSVAMELADFSPAASLAPSSVVMSPVISSLSSLSTSTSTRRPSPTTSSQIPSVLTSHLPQYTGPFWLTMQRHREAQHRDAACAPAQAQHVPHTTTPPPPPSHTSPAAHASASHPHVSINSSAHTSDPHAPGSAHTSLSTHDYPSLGLPRIDFTALPPRPNLRGCRHNQTACRIDQNTHLFYVSDCLGTVFVNRDWAEQDARPYGVQYFSTLRQACDHSARHGYDGFPLPELPSRYISMWRGAVFSDSWGALEDGGEYGMMVFNGTEEETANFLDDLREDGQLHDNAIYFQ
ncbi:hypothetical protein B0H13DRAFT_2359171 [Mycena leptocephala]|nr:hypothetical protein B0H13DRAFT_2359171 [Mycena leptocephala]